MSGNTDIDGLVKLFEQAGSEIKGEVRKTVFKGAQNVKRRAADLAPDVYMASKIDFEIDDSGDEVSADIENQSPLGDVLEFGSPTNPGGRPFMLPALDPEGESLEKYVGLIVDKLFR
jgi:hypothetical protein